MNHLISDLIIRVKNAAKARRIEVELPYSNINKAVLQTLTKQGFLQGVKETSVEGRKMLVATIRYEGRQPVVTDVSIISKPSLRVYSTSKNILQTQRKGRRTLILSTSKGVMTGKEAMEKGVGGEVLFAIW
ncbi:MAG TPA: 30S ribosomal protein S8 [Candidatus Saccharimonadales bacterium]|nr:30S ribosomal protein S8 [Candidatus Saccharimonadales bacterium]